MASEDERRLPGLGEWDGPIHGDLGVLADDGDRVRCHCCGGWYQVLGRHVGMAHGLLADEYRAIFGLNRGTGLAGPTYRARSRLFAERNLKPYWPAAAEALTPEGRAAGRTPRRLEMSIDPHNRAVWHESAKKGGARVRELAEQGAWTSPGIEALRRNEPNRRARMQELMRDPDWKARWLEKVRAAGRGPTWATIECCVCHRPFQARAYVARAGRATTCGPACARERRKQTLEEHSAAKRPGFAEARRADATRQWREREGFDAIAARLRALDPARLLDLTDLDRTVVGRYYGLVPGAAVTKTELGQELGRSRQWVRERLGRCLAVLLEDTPP